MMKIKPYLKAYRLIAQSGDVLIKYGGNFASKGISLAQQKIHKDTSINAPSHVGMIEIAYGRVWIVEAIGSGVVMRPLSQALRMDLAIYEIKRLTGHEEIKRNAAPFKLISELVGKNYGIQYIIDLFFGKIKTEDQEWGSKYICSGAVSFACREGWGLDPKANVGDNYTTPYDISIWKKLKTVSEFAINETS